MEIIWLFNFIGSLVCHQRPDRTLWVGGHYLPVCARCTGAYLGFILSYALLPFLSRKNARGPPNLFISLILTLPLWVDSIGQALGFWSSTNDARLITGLFFGIALAPLLVYVLSLPPFKSKIPVLKRIQPEYAVLDDKDSWFNVKAQFLSVIFSIIVFLMIRLMIGSSFFLFYWMLSIPIFLGIVLHFLVLPILLIGILISQLFPAMSGKRMRMRS
jgi:uncharacterized membrane protein